MSILQELRSLAGGGQNTMPVLETMALLCMYPVVKSSALEFKKKVCETEKKQKYKSKIKENGMITAVT